MVVLPEKASGTGIGRRIVYLDQNVLSDLAKCRLGRLRDGARKEALVQLSAALHGAIFGREDARCVESFFHRWESGALVLNDHARDGADELHREVWELLATYSWGLKFHTRRQVTQNETLLAVAAALGLREYLREFFWRGAFTADPHASNEASGLRVGDTLFSLGVMWEPDSVLRRGAAQRVEPSRATGIYSTFEIALAALRAELQEADRVDGRSWARRWHDEERPMDPAAVASFIASDAYGALPTNDVLTSLLAAVLSERSRPPQDSDFNDVGILALAIPYCDLVITDGYMASLARQLHLPETYGTRVLPASTQGLLEAAAWLGSPLAT